MATASRGNLLDALLSGSRNTSYVVVVEVSRPIPTAATVRVDRTRPPPDYFGSGRYTADTLTLTVHLNTSLGPVSGMCF